MKKIIIILFMAIIFAIPAVAGGQKEFEKFEIVKLIPEGLVLETYIGSNWWKGKFEGMPVLIHVIPTYNSINIDIIFVPKKEER